MSVATKQTELRRKAFGLAKAAWEAAGRPCEFQAWRHEQQTQCGVPSLRDAAPNDLFKVIRHFRSLVEEHKPVQSPKPHAQAKPSGKGGPAGGRKKWPEEWGYEKTRQMSKIEALLADMQLPWDYADSIAKRMFGVGCFRVDMCDKKQLTAIITALMKKQQKDGGRRTPPKKPVKQQEVQRELF